MWRALDLEVDGNTVWVALPDGIDVIQVLADVELDGRSATLRRPNILGGDRHMLAPQALRELIHWVKGPTRCRPAPN